MCPPLTQNNLPSFVNDIVFGFWAGVFGSGQEAFDDVKPPFYDWSCTYCLASLEVQHFANGYCLVARQFIPIFCGQIIAFLNNFLINGKFMQVNVGTV